MKNPALLIALLLLVLFKPAVAFADDHHWFKKVKDFFSSNFPSNLKYCVDYDGSIYVVGDIFKSKSCKKGDKELVLGPTSPASSSGSVGPQGPVGPQGLQGEPGPKGDQGIQGMQGVAGEKGDKGDKGDPGTSGGSLNLGYEIKLSEVSLDDNLAKDVTATCSAGKKVIGGGFNTLNVSDSGEVVIKSSFPNTESSWRVQGSVDASTASTTYSLQAYAICATLP